MEEKVEKINNFLEELDTLCHKYNYIKDKDIAQLDNMIIIKLFDKQEIPMYKLSGIREWIKEEDI